MSINVNATLNNQIFSDLTKLESNIKNIFNKTYTLKISVATANKNLTSLQSKITTLNNNIKKQSTFNLNTTTANKNLTSLNSKVTSLNKNASKQSTYKLNTATATKNLTNLQNKLTNVNNQLKTTGTITGNGSGSGATSTNTSYLAGVASRLPTALSAISSGANLVTSGFKKLGSSAMTLTMVFGSLINKTMGNLKEQNRINSLLIGKNKENMLNAGLTKDGVYKQAIEVSNFTGQKLNDVLTLGYEYISAGGTVDKMKNFMLTASMGMTSGGIEDPTKYTRSLMLMNNNYKGQDMGYLASLVSKLNSAGSVTPDEFASQVGKQLATIRNAGIDLDEYIGAMALASNKQGVSAVNGFTQLINSADNPQKTTLQMLDMAGLDWEKDFSSRGMRTKGIEKYFTDIKKAFESNNIALDATSIRQLFKRKESANTFSAIMADLDGLSAKIDLVKSTGAGLEEQWANYADSPYHKANQAMTTFNNSLSRLGESLLPAMTNIMNVVSNVMSKFAEWASQNQKLVTTIMTVVGALLVAGVAGFFLNGIIGLVTGTMQIFKGVVIITQAIMSIFTSKGIIGTIVAFGKYIVMIGAVVYAMWFLHKNFGSVGKGIVSILGMVGSAVSVIMAGILDVIALVIKGLGSVLELFNGITPTIRLVGKVIDNDLLANFAPFQDVTWTLAGGIEGLADKAWGLADKLGQPMQDAIDGGMDFNPLDDIGNIIGGLKDKLTSAMSGGDISEALKDEIDSALSGLENNLDDTLDDVNWGGLPGVDGGSDAKKKEIEKYAQAVDNLGTSIKNMAKNFVDSLNPLDKFNKKVISGQALNKRVSQNAKNMEDFANYKEKLLGSTKLSQATKNYIANLGPDKLGELKALSKMDETSLGKFNTSMDTIQRYANQSAYSSVYNINVYTDADEKDGKRMAQQMASELKRLGINIAK